MKKVILSLTMLLALIVGLSSCDMLTGKPLTDEPSGITYWKSQQITSGNNSPKTVYVILNSLTNTVSIRTESWETTDNVNTTVPDYKEEGRFRVMDNGNYYFSVASTDPDYPSSIDFQVTKGTDSNSHKYITLDRAYYYDYVNNSKFNRGTLSNVKCFQVKNAF